MDNQLMDKIYRISRIVLVVITFIIFNILFINEDKSWEIVALIFTAIVFGVSFPSSIFSKKIIDIGNSIEGIIPKIIYYIIILPFFIFVLFLVIYWFVLFVFNSSPTPNEFATMLGQALLALFVVIVGAICVVVPYIQTLIVLILMKFIKNNTLDK